MLDLGRCATDNLFPLHSLHTSHQTYSQPPMHPPPHPHPLTQHTHTHNFWAVVSESPELVIWHEEHDEGGALSEVGAARHKPQEVLNLLTLLTRVLLLVWTLGELESCGGIGGVICNYVGGSRGWSVAMWLLTVLDHSWSHLFKRQANRSPKEVTYMYM